MRLKKVLVFILVFFLFFSFTGVEAKTLRDLKMN